MQIRFLAMFCGLAVFAGGVAAAYLLVFQVEHHPSRVAGSGLVRQGQVERALSGAATEIVGRGTVEAGGGGATVDLAPGVRATMRPNARLEIVSKSDLVIGMEWRAGDVDVAHDGKAKVTLSMAVEISGHDGARFLTTGGQLQLRAGGKNDARISGPRVIVVAGDVLREHRGEIARARRGESLAVRAERSSAQELSAELVRTVGTGSTASPAASDGEAPAAGRAPSSAPTLAAPPPSPRVDAARISGDVRRVERAGRTRDGALGRGGRGRADARQSVRASAAAPTPSRAEATARREERATAAPDAANETRRTRIIRSTTWR